ncbi:MAG: HEAT repeat domain-containing protein [Bradymonadales bacterium]|nr:HEAT repeat domain-containing protein [Bradymonadales bacterium]
MSRERHRLKTGYKLLVSPGDMALGARFARSRLSLVMTVVATTVLFLGYVLVTTTYMRERSTDVVLNLVLISGGLLLMLVAAYFQSLLGGDLLFPGRWRERVVLGLSIEEDGEESELETITRTKDHLPLFYLMLAALLFANYLLFGWVSGGFLGEYHEWRYQHTLLRSPDVKDRIRGIRNVTSPLEQQAKNEEAIRLVLVDLCQDGDREVQQWALWAAGELLLFEAAPVLREIVADEESPESVRARAAEALGYLANREGAELMARLLASSMGREELALGLLRGLGLARLREAGPEIALFLGVEPIEVRAHAFWALGRSQDRRYREELFTHAREGSFLERCFAAEALKFMANEEDRTEAHQLFDSAPDQRCERVAWRLPYHWDEDSSFFQEIVVAESLKAKFLKVVFTAGGLAERQFLLDLVRDPGQPDEIRYLARELARRIDTRR